MSILRRIWKLIRTYFPFGLLWGPKPAHFREMLKVAWENRDALGWAWRVLRHGVCDGCSLGPYGLRDNVISGTHLCLTRLKLLRLNTMPALPDGAWEDIGRLRLYSNEQLHRLGRLPYPLLYRKGDRGFRRISWDEAVKKVADALRAADPDRVGFFASSRGITNETYYTFQKLARIAGTPHVDSCARLCHAASTNALKETVGYGATTCSLSDVIGADLVMLFGTDVANNQPMMMKYLHYAKRKGTRVVVINPFREPALDRYWVPSVVSSAVFGTKICDDFFQVKAGGDVWFCLGVMKALKAMDAFDRTFIAEHTTGFGDLEAQMDEVGWDALEEGSGVTRAEMERLAQQYAKAKTAVLIWSMGLTQHRFGVENVRSVVLLGLCRGMIGRPHCGLMPIRGHSGVQGTAECGADADKLPGAVDITPEDVAKLEAHWGHPIPARRGLKAAHLLDRALESGLDVLYTLGGNYLDTLPEPGAATRALANVRLRVHQDILINTSALVEPAMEGGEVLLLPAQTRYEQRGGGTSTSTERRIRFTPELPGHRIGEALAEWEIPVRIGRALRPDRPDLFAFDEARDVRREMAKVMPLYAGIETLEREGQWVQWGGPHLGAGGIFKNLPDGRARFRRLELPRVEIPPGMFFLASRRGKQFNSITWGKRDLITGAPSRQAVFFSREDAQRLGLREGMRVRLRSETGTFDGVVQLADLKPGHLQAFWPECNPLIAHRYDPISGEPDYNAFVTVEALDAATTAEAARSAQAA
ncbi:MAG: FdhF/YdeP family oxidoreductase [Myxococcaceae bacterium]|nr:FdhF/YdeP family oxidoreductase [Myxococcaceae bacterium]